MSLDATRIADIDARLQHWNQGDIILRPSFPFVYIADYDQPITSGSRAASAAADKPSNLLGTVAVRVPGVTVVTQSCDLVRSCRDQPYVKVAALQLVNQDFLDTVRKGQRPRYVYIPGIADQLLVANLDAISTVEKAIIASIDPKHRVRGCQTDAEVRELSAGLSRNLSRFAFPDNFSIAMKGVQDRILAKHGKVTRDGKGKITNEGKVLTALREIRVACSPSWSAASPTLTFYFIFNDRSEDSR